MTTISKLEQDYLTFCDVQFDQLPEENVNFEQELKEVFLAFTQANYDKYKNELTEEEFLNNLMSIHSELRNHFIKEIGNQEKEEEKEEEQEEEIAYSEITDDFNEDEVIENYKRNIKKFDEKVAEINKALEKMKGNTKKMQKKLNKLSKLAKKL